jgi:hypothetical protein
MTKLKLYMFHLFDHSRSGQFRLLYIYTAKREAGQTLLIAKLAGNKCKPNSPFHNGRHSSFPGHPMPAGHCLFSFRPDRSENNVLYSISLNSTDLIKFLLVEKNIGAIFL